jgi:tetratricopeptide (TPR) repeat protein
MMRAVRVGSYEIGERIGRGGTAEVYAARGPDGEVAIKLLARGAAASENEVRRFEREARAAEALSHPHLIRVIAHGVDAELGPWLAMPLVRGMTLRDLFGGTKLAPESAVALLYPIVDALAAMHAASLVHRDVKPENVMLSPLGDATLVDLGLAHFEGATRHTAEGEIAGSIPYLSPERIETRDIAASADVWSLGVMFYELVAGARPFARDRAGEEVAAILAARFTALDQVDRRTSMEFASLVARCLTRDPAARIPDARALRLELDRIAHGPAAQMRAERVSLLTDREGYGRGIARRAAERLREEASRAIDRGDSFGALKLLDRALAYQPDDAAAVALVERAAEGAPAKPAVDTRSVARPRRAALFAIPAVLVTALAGIAIAFTIEGGSDDATAPRTARTAHDAGMAADAGLEPIAALDPNDFPADRPRVPDDLAAREGEALVPEGGYGVGTPSAQLRAAERTLARDPNDARAKLDRAMALLALGRVDEGRTLLEEIAREHPRDARIAGASGFVALREGRFDDADRHLSRALEIDPELMVARRTRGILRHRRGRFRDAYLDLWRALEISPLDELTLAELVHLYQEAERTRDAVPLIRRVLARRPTNADAWADLAIALEPGDEALEAADRSLSIDADHPRALAQRCRLLAQLARPSARSACTTAIERLPPDARLHVSRALAASRESDHTQALADGDRAVELAPGDGAMLFNRHFLRGRAGRVEQAVADLRASCALGFARACGQLRDDGLSP